MLSSLLQPGGAHRCEGSESFTHGTTVLRFSTLTTQSTLGSSEVRAAFTPKMGASIIRQIGHRTVPRSVGRGSTALLTRMVGAWSRCIGEIPFGFCRACLAPEPKKALSRHASQSPPVGSAAVHAHRKAPSRSWRWPLSCAWCARSTNPCLACHPRRPVASGGGARPGSRGGGN
jgi:hypothetical protein